MLQCKKSRNGGFMGKKRITLLLCTLLLGAFFGAPGAALANEEGEQYVRVRLSAGQAQTITVEVTGQYRCNGVTFSGGVVTLKRSGTHVRVIHSELGVLSDNDFIYLERRAQEADEASFSLQNERYGYCRYLGDLYCCVDGDGTLCLVNYVTMTQYLYGVTGGELRNSHPIEALKAQTIAAKGYAVLCRGSEGAYDLTDRPNDQVYKGYRPADDNVIAAVDAVAGEMLTLDGEPIKCYYCTSNGGQTLTPAMRWGSGVSDGAYRMRFDPYDVAGSGSAAVLTVAADSGTWPAPLAAFLLNVARQQEARVAAVLEITEFSGFYDAENHSGTERYPAARAPQAWATALLRVRLLDGATALIRCGFAPESLLKEGVVSCEGADVWFVREAEGGGWQVVFGRSSGHRVGMSHCGMLEMARQGFSYAEILAFYYPGAELTREKTAASQRQVAAPAPEPTYTLRVVEKTRSDEAVSEASVWEFLFGWLF